MDMTETVIESPKQDPERRELRLGTIKYGYNFADELTSATGSTTAWSYDSNGDQTKNGLMGQTQAVNDRLAVTGLGSTSYTDFGTGNAVPLTRGPTTYGISPLGISSETIGGTTTEFIRTADGAPIAEKQSAGLYYFVRDSIGSVVGLLDSSGNWSGGYSYSPFGEARSTTNSTVIFWQFAAVHRRLSRQCERLISARGSLLRRESRTIYARGSDWPGGQSVCIHFLRSDQCNRSHGDKVRAGS